MFTYLAARQEVLDLNAVAATIADTELDLTPWIPVGAHTVILAIEINQIALGGAAGYNFLVYKTLAQGNAIALFGWAAERDSQGAQAHIPLAAGKIRYSVFHPGGALSLDINAWILGYIE